MIRVDDSESGTSCTFCLMPNLRFFRLVLIQLIVAGCVSGPGQPCCSDAGPRHFPAAGEEEEAYRNVDGGLLRTVVWPMPGFAPRVEEDGSGTGLKSIYHVKLKKN